MLLISLWLIYLINYVSMKKMEVSNNNLEKNISNHQLWDIVWRYMLLTLFIEYMCFHQVIIFCLFMCVLDCLFCVQNNILV